MNLGLTTSRTCIEKKKRFLDASKKDYVESIDALDRAVATLKKQVRLVPWS